MIMIVVAGATRNVGRPLVEALAAAGEEVMAVSRNAAGDLPDGVRHQQADLGSPESLKVALDGADALFLLLAGDMLVDGSKQWQLLDAVKSSGVRRVVLLSSQGARTRPQSPSHSGLRQVEEAVQNSGLESTILRAGGFASNAFGWAQMVRSQRMVAAPFGDVALPVVDPADIAAVAAAALLDARHDGHAYELTGPEAASPRQQAEAIGDAVGAPVRFHELSREEAREMFLQFMPAAVADGTLDILGRPSAEEQQVSPDVERVLGRAPGSFGDWARRNAAAFR
jgi:uncharacterized protein YbjT (DUF2867 family)